MKYKDIEKFVHDNKFLAREIANFNCEGIGCSECVFKIDDPTICCLSTAAEVILDLNIQKVGY